MSKDKSPRRPQLEPSDARPQAARQKPPRDEQTAPPYPLVGLHRSVGNRAVQHMLRSGSLLPKLSGAPHNVSAQPVSLSRSGIVSPERAACRSGTSIA